MALDFLTNATGDPKELKVRFAFQSDADVPSETNMEDFYVFGQGIAPSRSVIEPQSIAGSGAPLPPLPGKLVIPERDLPFGDLDPTNKGQLMAFMALFGNYSHTSNVTWHEWKVSLEEASAVDRRLTVLVDDNVNPRRRVSSWNPGAITLGAEPDGNYSCTASGAAEGFDLFGAVTQSAGTGSTLPTVLGRNDEHYEAAGDDIFIRVDATAGDDITVSVKVGAAAAYSHSFTITAGRTDQRAFDEGGNLIGPPGDPMRIYWPTGFTLTALDEFTVEERRAAWTQSGLTRFAIPSVNTRWILDGVTTRTEGGYSVEIVQNLLVEDDVYGEQGRTVTRSGPLNVTVSPTRTVRNLDFQRILYDADNVGLVIDGETETKIDAGPPAIPYRSIFILPHLEAAGDQFVTEAGAENRSESLTLTAGEPSATFTYDPGYGVASYSVNTHAVYVSWNNHAAIGGLS